VNAAASQRHMAAAARVASVTGIPARCRRSTVRCSRLTLDATFVARSFSGDKAQLVPIIQAGLAHRGFAFIDIISPCVTFNDHDGSTKSYAYTREHKVEVVQADFVPLADEITTEYQDGSSKNVMMHDGSWVKFRKLAKDYDPTDRDGAYAHIREHQRKGEVVTGLLYISPDSKDVHDQNDTVPGRSTTCRTPSSAPATTHSRSCSSSSGRPGSGIRDPGSAHFGSRLRRRVPASDEL